MRGQTGQLVGYERANGGADPPLPSLLLLSASTWWRVEHLSPRVRVVT